MTNVTQLRQARPSDEEIEALSKFLHRLVQMHDQPESVDGLGEFFDDGQLFEAIGRYVVQVLIEENPFSIDRIVAGYRVLFSNACDPEVSYLKWKPHIAGLLEEWKQKDNGFGGQPDDESLCPDCLADSEYFKE